MIWAVGRQNYDGGIGVQSLITDHMYSYQLPLGTQEKPRAIDSF